MLLEGGRKKQEGLWLLYFFLYLLVDLFNPCGCFAFMHVCIAHVCLLLSEARGRNQIPLELEL